MELFSIRIQRTFQLVSTVLAVKAMVRADLAAAGIDVGTTGN